LRPTIFIDHGRYSCTVRASDGPHEGDAFDYLAAYVSGRICGTSFPAELVVKQGSIALDPSAKNDSYQGRLAFAADQDASPSSQKARQDWDNPIHFFGKFGSFLISRI